MIDQLKRYAILIAAVLGIAVGWMLHAPGKPVHEAAAPAQRQADGSLVLERAEGTKTPPALPHAIPKGAKEERRVQVVVQPPRGTIFHPSSAAAGGNVRWQGADLGRGWNPTAALGNPSDSGWGLGNQAGAPALPGVPPPDSCDCAPVTVDLSLVRMSDKTRRVVASSPDGQILSGVDIPIESAPEIRIPRWTLSAIAVADLNGIRPGALLTRRMGPFVVGGGLLSDPGLTRPGTIVQAGISW